MDFRNIRLSPRTAALVTALPVVFAAVAVLSLPSAQHWVASGPVQSDHEGVDCVSCHLPAPGTTRQQVQAKVQHALGLRETPVNFGHQPVTSEACIACHERPNERHPIYRFREPRFEEALLQVEATSCLGCHSEHTEARAFVEPGFCRHCHEDLKMKSDPLDKPHVELIADNRWSTCLGCHDFHGNHADKAPSRVADAHDIALIEAYLAQGPTPYDPDKLYEARTQP